MRYKEWVDLSAAGMTLDLISVPKIGKMADVVRDLPYGVRSGMGIEAHREALEALGFSKGGDSFIQVARVKRNGMPEDPPRADAFARHIPGARQVPFDSARHQPEFRPNPTHTAGASPGRRSYYSMRRGFDARPAAERHSMLDAALDAPSPSSSAVDCIAHGVLAAYRHELSTHYERQPPAMKGIDDFMGPYLLHRLSREAVAALTDREVDDVLANASAPSGPGGRETLHGLVLDSSAGTAWAINETVAPPFPPKRHPDDPEAHGGAPAIMSRGRTRRAAAVPTDDPGGDPTPFAPR